MSAWVNVAKLTKAKTLEGGLTCHAMAGLPFLLEEGMEVTFVPPILRFPRSSKVAQIDHKGNGKYLIYFEDIDTMSLSEQLENHYCLVAKADLPAGWDEKPEEQFSAFSVSSVADGYLGQVMRIEENPAHPLLVIDYHGRELLIPLVEEFIVCVDDVEQTLELDLPEGLLDL